MSFFLFDIVTYIVISIIIINIVFFILSIINSIKIINMVIIINIKLRSYIYHISFMYTSNQYLYLTGQYQKPQSKLLL